VFTAPIEKGPTRNLTHSSDAHDREAAWSPDGAKVAYISDSSGEEEVWLADQAGAGQPERLTSDGHTRRQGLVWSPDGKRIAFSDSTGRIGCVEVASKTVVAVAHDLSGNVGDYTWSGDGGWLAFSLADPSGFRSIWLWNAAEAKLTRVTDETFNESEPIFDPAGKYLYYLSDREYAPQISSAEWNFATDRTTGIFALALRKDVEHPFPPQSDEVTLAKRRTRRRRKGTRSRRGPRTRSPRIRRRTRRSPTTRSPTRRRSP
jgi:tricorn protease